MGLKVEGVDILPLFSRREEQNPKQPFLVILTLYFYETSDLSRDFYLREVNESFTPIPPLTGKGTDSEHSK